MRLAKQFRGWFFFALCLVSLTAFAKHHKPPVLPAPQVETPQTQTPTQVQNDPYFHSVNHFYPAETNSGYHSVDQQPTSSALQYDTTSPDQNTASNNPGLALRAKLTSELESISQNLNTGNVNNNYVSVNSSHNVWQQIQQNLQLGPDANSVAVRNQITWFLGNRKILNRMILNAIPYLYYAYQQTQLRHMPAIFTLLPIMESGYDPNAYSHAGAAGLWQMMPETASDYSLDINWWYDARRDVITSTNAALNFLVELHHDLADWNLAIAAYDVGEGAIQAAMHTNKMQNRPMDFWSLPLPNETRDYIPKLLALGVIIKNADQYNVHLPFVPNKPFFVAFEMDSQLDMAEISRLSGTSQAVIQSLNPGMRRWATPPSKYILLLPADHAQLFENNLASVAGRHHISWQYHEVHNGETLYTIAHNYHTSAELLREVNNLDNYAVQPNDGILVPLWLNHKYKTPIGVLNLSDNSVMTNASVVNPAKENIPIAMPNINTQLPANITANDILSGQLPADIEQNPIQNNSNPVVDNAANNQQPITITSHDDLKTLIKKIYGSD